MAGELKSVYKRGAEDGLHFGIYLSVLYMVMIAGASYSLVSLVAFVMTNLSSPVCCTVNT